MKLRKDVIIFGLICAVIGAIIAMAISVLTYHPTTATEAVREVVKRDTITNTITLRDTVTQERIRHHYTEVIKRDTIKADTVLITERKGYTIPVATDSVHGEIYASVSGVNPSLDSLSYRLNVPHTTITERVEVEKIIKQKTHLSYGVGVMAGYSIFSKRPDITAGLFIGYSF